MTALANVACHTRCENDPRVIASYLGTDQRSIERSGPTG